MTPVQQFQVQPRLGLQLLRGYINSGILKWVCGVRGVGCRRMSFSSSNYVRTCLEGKNVVE